jgi:methionine-rich copper-binding protein CopC
MHPQQGGRRSAIDMRSISIIANLAAFLLLGTVVAAAHAFLDHAEPRVGNTVRPAPRELTLWFTQNLEPAFSTVTVTDASGQRVDAGKPSISGSVVRVPLRSIGAGTYRVTWRVLSVDTHTTEGSFSFTVRGVVTTASLSLPSR